MRKTSLHLDLGWQALHVETDGGSSTSVGGVTKTGCQALSQ